MIMGNKILKIIYKIIPFKKEIYSMIKGIYTPSKSIYQHLHFEGVFKVQVSMKSNFKIRHYGYQVENEIFWNGIYNGWERHSLQLWAELCKRSKIIFDIGANTGVYALMAKSLNPASRVFAIEPVERVFKKLEENVHLNSYDITCVRKAASNFDGTATIYDKNTEHTYSVTVNMDISNNPLDSIPTTIETIKLDTIIHNHSLLQIDLLKIDVETHEVEVLEGFKGHLEKFRPNMLIEILNDQVAKGIEEIISDMDYVFFNIDEDSGLRQVMSLTKSDYYNFLICRPELIDEIEILKLIVKGT